MKRLSMGKAIVICFGVLVLLLLGSGVAGLKGVGTLSDSLRFVTGPAWDAADGAMEGTIGIQNEMILMQRILRNEIGHDAATVQIKEAEGFASEAFGRMLGSGLMGKQEIDQAQSLIKAFRTERENLMMAHHKLEQARLALGVTLTNLDNVLMEIEGEVEAGMDNNALISLSGREVQRLWNMADAVMEIRIALLRRNMAMEHLLASRGEKVSLIKEFRTQLSDIDEGIEALQRFSDDARLATYLSAYKQQFDTVVEVHELFSRGNDTLGVVTTRLIDHI